MIQGSCNKFLEGAGSTGKQAGTLLKAPADASTLPSFAGGPMNSSKPRSAGVLLTRRACWSSTGANAA